MLFYDVFFGAEVHFFKSAWLLVLVLVSSLGIRLFGVGSWEALRLGYLSQAVLSYCL